MAFADPCQSDSAADSTIRPGWTDDRSADTGEAAGTLSFHVEHVSAHTPYEGQDLAYAGLLPTTHGLQVDKANLLAEARAKDTTLLDLISGEQCCAWQAVVQAVLGRH